MTSDTLIPLKRGPLDGHEVPYSSLKGPATEQYADIGISTSAYSADDPPRRFLFWREDDDRPEYYARYDLDGHVLRHTRTMRA